MSVRPIRVGVVGPGWWTETMFVPAVRSFQDAELVAICGRDAVRTRAFAEANAIPLVYTDPNEMFASGEIDAVIISTANNSHHPLTMAALHHQLHVLCEKPLAMNPQEADEMVAAATEAGVTCLVPFTYRFMPISQYLHRLVREGFVGTPYLINLRYYTGFARNGAYAWRFDLEHSGAGVVGDLGTHWIDMARWLIGEISAVTCTLTHLVPRQPRSDGEPYDVGDDGANILVEFASGAHGVIVVSAVCHEDGAFGQSHQIDIHGSEGTLYAVNDWIRTQQVRGARDGDSIVELPIPDDIWGEVRRDDVHDTYRDVFRTTDVLTRGWLAGIRDGRTDVAPSFADGAAAQRIVAACQLSAREGRRVRVDEIQGSPGD